MIRMIYLISSIAVFGLLLFTSCKNDKEDVINSNIDYFPLQQGNYWELTNLPLRLIDTTENLDGKKYFRMVTKWDTCYFRKTPNGKVYKKYKDSEEFLAFDFNAKSGQTWAYKSYGYDWNATLESKTDSIIIDQYIFKNCFKFYYDIPQYTDEEREIWLAPGIGFVEEYYYGGTSTRKAIKRVKINGVETQFQ